MLGAVDVRGWDARDRGYQGQGMSGARDVRGRRCQGYRGCQGIGDVRSRRCKGMMSGAEDVRGWGCQGQEMSGAGDVRSRRCQGQGMSGAGDVRGGDVKGTGQGMFLLNLKGTKWKKYNYQTSCKVLVLV